MDKQYQQKISDLFSRIPSEIIDITKPRVRSRPPTQAFSEFLTNREQGDWAESLVQTLINDNISQLRAVKYGKSDDIIAGDPAFPEFYEAYQDELDSIGKKPDVLIFDNKTYKPEWGLDVSRKANHELDSIAKGAMAGLEIRSSSFLVSKYEEHIVKTKSKSRNFLSFTPKAEDLLVINKWITNFGVPHFYIQVFFDRIYMISFWKILEIITEPTNKNVLFTLEKNAKNQFKSTIHIDVNQGVLLAKDIIPPEHMSEVKELSRGRLLYYVKFKGGKAAFDAKKFLAELES
ncbi:MAG: AccI family restriction endonuclease [candidate division WOR-3 bacterium]|nr:AccI family restriction endonuclease [candidate division WOR-3 bacterium]